ncbi:hypothetical protein HMPREF1556_00926 [Porphyromonas sp. oral taxon 278 str. W7784]|nr:hypothetical protein HMPREF1556_00926 [Porphyromonas sp. oral taxon 278 str. W7784]
MAQVGEAGLCLGRTKIRTLWEGVIMGWRRDPFMGSSTDPFMGHPGDP